MLSKFQHIQHLKIIAAFISSHFAHLLWAEWLNKTEKVAASTTIELIENSYALILNKSKNLFKKKDSNL